MKLAEALILRANLQQRVQQQRKRLTLNALVQEGGEPAEDPRDLLVELEKTCAELEDLIRRINHTNTKTRLAGFGSLTDGHAATAGTGLMRLTRTELRQAPTVDVPAIRKKADDYAKEFRELDTEIQSTNWQTELI